MTYHRLLRLFSLVTLLLHNTRGRIYSAVTTEDINHHGIDPIAPGQIFPDILNEFTIHDEIEAANHVSRDSFACSGNAYTIDHDIESELRILRQACSSNADCGDQVCTDGTCSACTSNTECDGLGCDTSAGTCTGCCTNTDCSDQACDRTTGTCSACSTDADCGDGEVCDSVAGTCSAAPANILVAAGIKSTNFRDKTKVTEHLSINSDETASISNVIDFPCECHFHGAVAFTVDNSVFVCAGFFTNHCDQLESGTDGWVHSDNLRAARWEAATVELPNGDIWATGGRHDTYGRFTEIFSKSTLTWGLRNENNNIVQLEETRQGHALVGMDNDYYITGGYPGWAIKSAKMYTWPDGPWVELPDMRRCRYNHGSFISTYKCLTVLFVVGGYGSDSRGTSEYLVLDDPTTAGSDIGTEWLAGPDLPRDVYDSSIVHHTRRNGLYDSTTVNGEDPVYMIGGWNFGGQPYGNVIVYKDDAFTLLADAAGGDLELDTPRWGHVDALLPDGFTFPRSD